MLTLQMKKHSRSKIKNRVVKHSDEEEGEDTSSSVDSSVEDSDSSPLSSSSSSPAESEVEDTVQVSASTRTQPDGHEHVKVVLSRMPTNPDKWMKQHNITAIRTKDGDLITAKESDSSPEKNVSRNISTMGKRRTKAAAQSANAPNKEVAETDSETTPKKKSTRRPKIADDSDFELDEAATKEETDEDEPNAQGDTSDSEIMPVKRKRVKRDNEEEKSSPDGSTEAKKKKKRRVKQMTDSEDDDSDGKGDKVKRKNIRKVIKDKDLEADTKQAARDEMERKRRVAERQKLFNEICDEKQEQVKVMESLVLDVEESGDGEKKELLWVDKKLVRKLKPHQGSGIRFMFDACFFVAEAPGDGKGLRVYSGALHGSGKDTAGGDSGAHSAHRLR